MHLLVDDRVDRPLRSAVVVQRLTRVRVDVESRKIAAADIDADSVAFLENVAAGIELDREGINLSRIHQLLLPQVFAKAGADDPLGDVQVETTRPILAGGID